MTIAHPGPARVQRSVYGPHAEHFGELRLPLGAGPHPVIVWLHGGGWRAEITLAGAVGICTALTARGYATWSVEYRRVGNGGGWPATFDDVLAAAGYVQTLATEAPIDLSRLFLGGQSAGGQLALWLASRTTAGHEATASARLPRVRAVLGLAPATDLRTSAAANQTNPIVSLLGGTPAEVTDRYAATSPIELVPIGLPQLIVHGTADSIVPYAMSQAYVAAAQAAGDRVDLLTVDGAEHLDLWNPASAVFERVVETASAFFDENCA